MKIGILTISNRAAAGIYEDRSGPLLAELVQSHTPWQIVGQTICPDQMGPIAEQLATWADAGFNLILTSGGTGFSPSDITPEATQTIIERQVPGIPEALRAASLLITRHAMLSRGIAGIRGKTLIINLPGNPKAVKEQWAVLQPILPHALDLLTEKPNSEADHRTV